MPTISVGRYVRFEDSRTKVLHRIPKRYLGIAALVVAIAICALGVMNLTRRRVTCGPRNIVVISLCSVRPDHMGCYGYPRRTTPSIDALAAESVVFENAVSQWPKTAPAFASIMCGKYGHSTGVMRVTARQRLGDEHETLAEVLRASGYETGAFVSSAALSRVANIVQGFDTVVESFRLEDKFAATSARAKEWILGEHAAPFFAWVHYNNAHLPYLGGGSLPDRFVDDEYYDATRRVEINNSGSLPIDLPHSHPYRQKIIRPDLGGVRHTVELQERPTELDFYIARYDAGVYAADHDAGVLLDALREAELFDNTIIVVIGDHGEALGDHNLYFEHGRFPYDDCAKVPLLIRSPGNLQPRRVSAPVAAFGLAPTLLDMVGLEPPAAMEAESFRLLAEGRGRSKQVFSESGYQYDYTLAVRDTTWKLTHIPNEIDRALMRGSEWELYNLSVDPRELTNRIDDSPAVADRLKKVLQTWSAPWIASAYGDHDRPKGQVDEETLRNLRSLGYIE